MNEVVAALICRGERLMICQRPEGKAQALLWELAGGKVEPGETKEHALAREFREELGVELKVGNAYMEVTHSYELGVIHLTVFSAEIAAGEPKLLEHRDLRWVTAEELEQYEFCPADIPVLQRWKQEMQRAANE